MNPQPEIQIEAPKGRPGEAKPDKDPGFLAWAMFIGFLVLLFPVWLLLLPLGLLLGIAGAIYGIIDGTLHPEKYLDQPATEGEVLANTHDEPAVRHQEQELGSFVNAIIWTLAIVTVLLNAILAIPYYLVVGLASSIGLMVLPIRLLFGGTTPPHKPSAPQPRSG